MISTVNGLLILLLFQYLGETIKHYLGIKLPGPVIGMFLLFLALCIYRGVPASINKASQKLIPLLSLMFMPAAAGIFFLGDRFASQWPAIIIATIVGSLLSLLFNCLMMKWLHRGQQKHG